MTTSTTEQVSIKLLGGTQVSTPKWESPKWRLTFAFSTEVSSAWKGIFLGLANGSIEKQASDLEETDSQNSWVIRFAKDEESVVEAYCTGDDVELLSRELRRVTALVNEQYARSIEERKNDRAYTASVQERIERLKREFDTA